MAIANIEVRELVKDKGLRYEDIANKIGVSRVWLSRLMSKELSQEWLRKILDAISDLSENQPHWIEHEKFYWTYVNDKGEKDGWVPAYECSECGSAGWRNPEVMNFCPVCGMKMRQGDY